MCSRKCALPLAPGHLVASADPVEQDRGDDRRLAVGDQADVEPAREAQALDAPGAREPAHGLSQRRERRGRQRSALPGGPVEARLDARAQGRSPRRRFLPLAEGGRRSTETSVGDGASGDAETRIVIVRPSWRMRTR